ncbi:hypothetical protein [Mariniflexile sp.]|uniref:hypothetical protein n=1 Tax=Mariniflexile sp. TaxID=1979402 RepID=UPI00404838DD
MEDFLLNYKNGITRFVEITAAVTGLFVLKKHKFSTAKYFIYFLVYLSLGDFINTYVKYIKNGGFLSFLKGTIFVENYWWTTLFWKIGAIIFFSFYYYKIITIERFKIILKYSGYIFFVFSIIYIVTHWENYFVTFFPIISVLGAIIIFLCTSFYFFEILQSDKILTFYKSLNFYISVAIFIWWLMITPMVFYDIYMLNNDWNLIYLRRYIYLFANIIMYSTFTFALIWCKPEND